jgi:hypothetical protein
MDWWKQRYRIRLMANRGGLPCRTRARQESREAEIVRSRVDALRKCAAELPWKNFFETQLRKFETPQKEEGNREKEEGNRVAAASST